MERSGERGRRLAIVIPAWQEADGIASVIAGLPRRFPGVSSVRVVVVDDGSTDATAAVANAAGADHVAVHPKHLGLARAWSTGIAVALRGGADVIVHTDADGQYLSEDIALLIAPVLDGEADLVVGERPIRTMEHFSRTKRALQRLGSRAVSVAAGTTVPDAPSGFRAMTAEAARSLNVYGTYTYTLETLIQAGRIGLTIVSVPVRVAGPTRPSRLVRSIPGYIWRSMTTIVRIAVLYRPFRFFASVGGVLLVAAVVVATTGAGSVRSNGEAASGQALFVAILLAFSALQAFLTAFLADAMAANRKLSERLLARTVPHDPPSSAASDADAEDRRRVGPTSPSGPPTRG